MKFLLSSTFLLFAGFLLLLNTSSAQTTSSGLDSNQEAIQKRMLRRLPEVVELLSSGQILEASTGYLVEANGVTLNGVNLRLIKQENLDRQEIYRLIANQASPALTTDEVAQLRAQLRPNF